MQALHRTYVPSSTAFVCQEYTALIVLAVRTHIVHACMQDNIPDAVIQKIQPYIDNEDFTPAAISKVSKACTSICQWARAMHKYHFVAKGVEPKRVSICTYIICTYNSSTAIILVKLKKLVLRIEEQKKLCRRNYIMQPFSK